MKKLKLTILLTMLLMTFSNVFAQLTPVEETQLQDFLTTNSVLVTDPVEEIVCEPIDDIFNLQCPKYQALVIGTNDYTDAIQQAITDASLNGGGIILFPGNTVVKITEQLIVKSNITFRASHSKATLKASDSYSNLQMIALSGREHVTFENIKFDGNLKTRGIVTYGTNTDITVLNCVFENMENAGNTSAGIYFQDIRNVIIKNCFFRTSDFGVDFHGLNSNIRIEDNTFENTLGKNPIRIQGNTDPNDRHYSEQVWILNNHITIKRAPSIIDDHAGLTRNTTTGVVEGLGAINGKPERLDENGNTIPADANYNEQYYTWRWIDKGSSAIYITSGNTDGNNDLSSYANYHQNIVVDGNIAIGSDYGFFDGGSADLYSLKDIVRLKCTNNVARNSGDLGFAIERSRNATVAHNTADRNNSFGIGIASTRNSVVSNNICDNNALRRDFMYNSTPYGGILVSGASINNIIEGNSIYSYSTSNVSFPTTDAYTNRTSPTDYYGIIFRANYDDTAGATSTEVPLNNKVGLNHYSGHKWGPIYNQALTTQIDESFSATTFPKDGDYPLGTWFRNSDMNNSPLGWSVINRVETELHSDWSVGDAYIDVLDPTNSIQEGDVFGVMLNDGNVHWSTIDELVFVSIGVQHYKVKLLQMPPSELTGAGIIDPAASRTQTSNGMDRIVILRWLTVTK